MSLDEQERRRRPYERDDDYRVMRFKTWCDSKGFSVPTGRTITPHSANPVPFDRTPRAKLGPYSL